MLCDIPKPQGKSDAVDYLTRIAYQGCEVLEKGAPFDLAKVYGEKRRRLTETLDRVCETFS
jgi:hypothetical protein